MVLDTDHFLSGHEAKPGDRFDVQVFANGYLLRKLEPVQSKPAKVRFVKRDGYTVP
jgi:hypothetical protein